jgi:hypothetical protein
MKMDAAACGIAVLAERLRRTLKARVRKSVGSIPTDCNKSRLFFGLARQCGGLLSKRTYAFVEAGGF